MLLNNLVKLLNDSVVPTILLKCNTGIWTHYVHSRKAEQKKFIKHLKKYKLLGQIVYILR
jgi:hypothetical protein